jgi:hypothetical protein
MGQAVIQLPASLGDFWVGQREISYSIRVYNTDGTPGVLTDPVFEVWRWALDSAASTPGEHAKASVGVSISQNPYADNSYQIAVDPSADRSFYLDRSGYWVFLTGGTVGGASAASPGAIFAFTLGAAKEPPIRVPEKSNTAMWRLTP